MSQQNGQVVLYGCALDAALLQQTLRFIRHPLSNYSVRLCPPEEDGITIRILLEPDDFPAPMKHLNKVFGTLFAHTILTIEQEQIQ